MVEALQLKGFEKLANPCYALYLICATNSLIFICPSNTVYLICPRNAPISIPPFYLSPQPRHSHVTVSVAGVTICDFMLNELVCRHFSVSRDGAALCDGHMTVDHTTRHTRSRMRPRLPARCWYEASTLEQSTAPRTHLATVLTANCVAMQVRQQAEALIDARKMIVNGAPLSWPARMLDVRDTSLSAHPTPFHQARWTSPKARQMP